jgi:cell wall-associated NlpC family hydrolase
VAKRYIGLPYRHHHIPGWDPSPESNPRSPGRGLDCSNFTSWVYNYGLGIKFVSHIRRQSSGPEAPGRVLAKEEAFVPGDLLFIMKNDRSRVSHVVIYLDEEQIIDSHDKYIGIRPFKGWYRTHLSHGRRIIE